MFRFIAHLLILIISVSIYSSCNNASSTSFVIEKLDTLYAPTYSDRFVIYKYGNSSILTIHQEEGSSKHIFLARKGETAPDGFDGMVMEVPLKRVICMSTTHIAMMEKLGNLDRIVGISGCQYVISTTVREAIEQKKIRDIGYDSGLNYELATIMQPDAIFVYGTQGDNAASTKKMTELGLPTIYIYEYLENNPLGKTEWLVAMGEFFDQRLKAEEIFTSIANNYNNIKQIIHDGIKQPKVMLNSPWRDTWFVPGNRSYIVQLLTDAGADYICKGFDSYQSRAISTEQAYVLCQNADFWLCPSEATSIDYLVSTNSRFANIPAVLNNRVFNNNRITTPMGGSDFWESGTINPDLILKDLIHILHPDLLPEHKLYYFHQLK
jgi:iron complex transport system substrate-binding protein